MSVTKQPDWAKLLAGPLVGKLEELPQIRYAGSGEGEPSGYYVPIKHVAKLLLAHLRESGICELLEAGQAMREDDCIKGISARIKNEAERECNRSPLELWDAAKAKLLAKGD